ncbi:MAG: hypothetical protein IKM24_01020, partial [Clostridia bacterium]|nr:hypothetical protein [Clostridia bacterium]
YVRRNRRCFSLQPGKYRSMPHKGALVLYAPTGVVACVYFSYITCMDIIGFYQWLSEGIMSLLR